MQEISDGGIDYVVSKPSAEKSKSTNRLPGAAARRGKVEGHPKPRTSVGVSASAGAKHRHAATAVLHTAACVQCSCLSNASVCVVGQALLKEIHATWEAVDGDHLPDVGLASAEQLPRDMGEFKQAAPAQLDQVFHACFL
jgi:hypothetical protein